MSQRTKIIYDAVANEATELAPSGGQVGFISYHRLILMMRSAGEMKANEIVSHLEMSDDGIKYRIGGRT